VVEINPTAVSIVVVSEAAPPDPTDYYYTGGNPLFDQTAVPAFYDFDVNVLYIRKARE
jgi:hypothetical protein